MTSWQMTTGQNPVERITTSQTTIETTGTVIVQKKNDLANDYWVDGISTLVKLKKTSTIRNNRNREVHKNEMTKKD